MKEWNKKAYVFVSRPCPLTLQIILLSLGVHKCFTAALGSCVVLISWGFL